MNDTPIAGRIDTLKRRLRPNPADPPRRWIRRHWAWLGLLALACAGVILFDTWLGTCGFYGCPSPSEIRAFHPSEGGNVYDRNNRLLGHLENVRRVNVPISVVPVPVRNAFIATEDRRFYQHNGLDWKGVLRAVFTNLSAGGVRQGFSTITMQVAHNSFLEDRYHGRSMRRKLIEVRISRLLERELTKDQILEHYLNVIYLGNGVNGIEAASLDLFGKNVDKLTLSEGALLAALPKAPSTYTPRRNPDKAEQRRNLVLGLMAQQGFITAAQAQASQAVPLRIADTEWRPSIANEPSALDAVRALVDSVMPDVLKEGDVNVYTTLDFTAQRAADRTVLKHIAEITQETRESMGHVTDEAQGALVALDPTTGDIRAVVPGRRTQRREFNRAFYARRQPGSTFKPFVYSAAIAAGYSPGTEVDDDPVQVQIGRQVWQPVNYSNNYAGRITFARALILSANSATVRVSRAVGEKAVIAAARRNGITSPLTPVPSIALGAEGVTPLELVTAYAPFANGGYRVQPRLVARIEAPDGTLLWSTEERQHTAAMDPRDAYEVNEMLQGVVNYGTGKAVRDYGVQGQVAGKTGTTNEGNDVWFVGFTPTLVAGIWFGYDTPRQISTNPSGGRLAAPAWAEFYQAGWHEPRGSSFAVPQGMVSAVVDPESGELATEWCPRRVREWYKPGTEPQETCHLHTGMPEGQIAVDANGNVTTQGGNNDPISQAAKGIGNILRKIIHW
ncbi:MAG TPA: PBP1A family penicillin-binding protein [Gemmatimonadaceae bacterium]|nr:PBP1A family penicillin-binding protein [Gemmatimonadaceae bacterium]